MANQFVVEMAKVERSTSHRGSSSRFSSKPLDLASPDLIGQRLSRDRDVPVDLDLRVGTFEARCRDQFGDRSLTVPPECMEAGVDDEPRGTPSLGVEHPEPLPLGAEESHLVGQPLRVEPPALDEGSGAQIGTESAERGQARVLGLEPKLEVMSRNGLVVDRRRDPAEDAGRKIGCCDWASITRTTCGPLSM